MWWFWSSLSFLYPGVRLQSSLWGLITIHYGAIQTRGNFPLPFNAPRCHSNQGELSDAIQCAAVPSKQGATIRCHSIRRGAVQTRGNFPLPCSSPQARGNLPSSEVVHLKSRFRARWAVVVCKNSFWKFLLRLTNFLEKYSIFKTGPFLGPKRGKFSVLTA